MIYGVKGLEAPAGHNNITVMIHKLNELKLPAKEFIYKSFDVWDTYDEKRIIGTIENLKAHLKKNDSIVAHSFGGLLVTKMLNECWDKNFQLKNIYLFNPSVNQMIKINEEPFKKMYIFYAPHDKLLRLAMWLPFNGLGALGKYGYRHPSDKITSIKIKQGASGWYKHEEAMFEPNLTEYGKFIKAMEKGNTITKLRALRDIRRE